MAEPFVSVIMPAYNAEDFLGESIRSVLAQTYQNWELIVVDDGSIDRTREIALEFAASDPRVRCVSQPNKKVAGAKNTGLKESRGELVAFIGADDLWLSEKLELQVGKLRETGTDILFSDGFVFFDREAGDETMPFSALTGKFSGDEMFDLLLVKNRIPDLSVVFRREVADRTGPFNEDPTHYRGCEDFEFWLRAAKNGADFYGMPERLVRYRRHADSMTAKKSDTAAIEIATLKRFLSDRHARDRGVRKRMRDSYRTLIGGLVAEGRISEARELMRGLTEWDGFGFVTSIQRVVIRVLPGKFNPVSDHLYALGSGLSKWRAGVRRRISPPASM